MKKIRSEGGKKITFLSSKTTNSLTVTIEGYDFMNRRYLDGNKSCYAFSKQWNKI